MATSNYLTIQALRAIAALMVVADHAFNMLFARLGPGDYWSNGAAGVDIFFVISGFVMVVSSRRLIGLPDAWLTFIRHRIVRIVPLYWLLTTLKVILVFAFSNLALRSTLDPGFVLGSYLFFPVVDSVGNFRPLLPVGWTLTYEFIFYWLFALALALRVNVLRVLIPAFVAIGILAFLRMSNWPEWTILFSTIVVEFLFGVLLAKLTLRGWSMSPLFAACALAAGFGLIVLIPERSENLRFLFWGVPAFAIVAGAVSLERQLSTWLPQWLLALGDASYSIYLMHGFVLPVLGLGLAAIHWSGYAAQATTVVASLVTGALSGWLCYFIVERPMMKWIKQRDPAKPARR
jgi:peptidoglycan/LPS O-acetylase OafA/YrhL